MKRRPFIGALASLPLAAYGARGGDGRSAWIQWRDKFVAQDGRVVDNGQNGISHSEGQAYGLLLAQAFGDRPTFERIEAWTRRTLANRQDALMSWAWDPSQAQHILDWHNATDGDLFRAWALLRASRVTGWSIDLSVTEAICRDVVTLCLAPDPRTPDALLLLPGAEARHDEAGVLVNPSYYHPRALRELGTAFGMPELSQAAAHGERLLHELASIGPVPDWIEVTTEGFAPPRDHLLRSSYDALRVPLYLAWSGLGDHAAVVEMRAAMRRATLPGHVAVAFDKDGTPLSESNEPGFRAIVTLASGGIPDIEGQDIANQPYYSATLHLLCAIARNERHN
nr:glycosyl hydrolase family 8 [Oceanicola sp. 22II-s10i]